MASLRVIDQTSPASKLVATVEKQLYNYAAKLNRCTCVLEAHQAGSKSVCEGTQSIMSQQIEWKGRQNETEGRS